MDDIQLEQAVWIGTNGRFRLMGRSPGFLDEWLSEAEELCAAFGERPAGVDCPPCVFAQPFVKRHVAVIQVADQDLPSTPSAEVGQAFQPEDSHENSQPKEEIKGVRIALGFRQLVFPRKAYSRARTAPHFWAQCKR